MKISLVNPTTNQIKRAKIGFSWTTFFFGFWPALFRGNWLWFLVMLVAETLFGLKTYAFGSLIVGIIFAFIYNKLYINGLLNNGWVAADAYSNQALISHGFIAANQNFTPSNDNQPMSRIQLQSRSHPFSVIMALVAAVCVVCFIYFSFGSMIETNLINLINPTKVQNKVNNPNQSDSTNSNPSPNQSSNDDNSQPQATTPSNQSDESDSVKNTINNVKDKINSHPDQTDDTPQPTTNPSPNQPTPDKDPDNSAKPDNPQSNPTNN
ncbi:hypothetical protein [Fructilactobacillus frigidiflavus]|uniref:hypothetical protein n=1 Tax=Fructilactobacillus frigidiflavus TaxID=3242688 RepID=UPI003756DD9D